MEEINWFIKHLEEDLNRYDKIFLIWSSVKGRQSIQDCFSREEQNNLATVLEKLKTKSQKTQRILCLSTEKNLGRKKEAEGNIFIEYQQITEAEASFFYRLYHMYEFSDRFSVISMERMHGSLFNFIDAGLLSIEEVAEALLQ